MSPSTLRLIGYGVGAQALIAVLALVNTWRVGYTERGENLAVICQTTREAADQPKLKCGDVPAQIRLMGEANGKLKTAIERQNAAVAELGRQSAAQQAEAERVVLNAAGRAKSAEATADSLRASSRADGRSGAPCEASEALKETWR